MTAMQDIESRNKHVAEELMRLSNIMANDDYLAQAVAELLASEHRTIQQSFWRMIQTTAVAYHEKVKGHTDMRNQASVEFTAKIVEANDYLPFI